jgi:hypothetical protein
MTMSHATTVLSSLLSGGGCLLLAGRGWPAEVPRAGRPD